MTAGNTALFVLVFSVVVLGQQTELVRPKTDNHLSGTQSNRQDRDTIRSAKAKEQMIRAMESTLLKMFGLASRPKPSKGVHIPDYMWKLYSDNVRKSTDSAESFLPEGIKITHTANTIRSFHHTDAEDEQELYPHPNHVRLVFNLSSIPVHEVLTDVQLRLYRKEVEFSDSLNQDHLKTHRIDVYEIIRPASKTSEAITRLIDTKLVHPRNTSWESFDIHPAVLKWRERPHLNHGLEVHFLTKNGQSSSVSNHVRLRRSTRTKERTWSGEQPLLVTYSDDRKKSKARTRRSHRRGRHSRSYKRKHNICKRHPLYVDFTDVGWNEWIVAPPGYQAFYCHGECPTVLPDYLNTTNHAIVQNLVNDVNPRSVPKACCIPTELSSINMLYLDEYDKVVLKNYDDMVVDACGCR